MNTHTCENEYPDIALITVARYAGVELLDILKTLGLDLGQHRSTASVSLSPFWIRHRRALHTVAKYSGIDVAIVAHKLEHPQQSRQANQIVPTEKAA